MVTANRLRDQAGECADAGIPHDWIVLAGELGYADGDEATGLFTTADPAPVRLRLTDLF